MIRSKLEVEHTKPNSKVLGPSYPVFCPSLPPHLRILPWQASGQQPHLRGVPAPIFIPDWDCFGLKCYVQRLARNARSEVRLHEGSKVDGSLALQALSAQVCWGKSLLSLPVVLGQRPGAFLRSSFQSTRGVMGGLRLWLRCAGEQTHSISEL